MSVVDSKNEIYFDLADLKFHSQGIRRSFLENFSAPEVGTPRRGWDY